MERSWRPQTACILTEDTDLHINGANISKVKKSSEEQDEHQGGRRGSSHGKSRRVTTTDWDSTIHADAMPPGFMRGLRRGIQFQKVKEGVPDKRTQVANRDNVGQARCHEKALGCQAKQTQMAALPV